MKVVATYNLKGGVGKTATAVTLAWLAARDGLRTLVWDLDPQGAATFYFRVQPKVRGGARAVVKGSDRLVDAIRGTDHERLDLLPADFRYRKLDVLLDGAKRSRKRLREALATVADGYDLVVLDCPPSISLTSENVFDVADALLVPLIPTTLSVRTLDQLLDFVRERRLRHLTVRPFFTMVDRRKSLHHDIVAAVPQRVPGFLAAAIPAASDVERMGVERAPLPVYAPSSPAAQAYQALWDELRHALDL